MSSCSFSGVCELDRYYPQFPDHATCTAACQSIPNTDTEYLTWSMVPLEARYLAPSDQAIVIRRITGIPYEPNPVHGHTAYHILTYLGYRNWPRLWQLGYQQYVIDSLQDDYQVFMVQLLSLADPIWSGTTRLPLNFEEASVQITDDFNWVITKDDLIMDRADPPANPVELKEFLITVLVDIFIDNGYILARHVNLDVQPPLRALLTDHWDVILSHLKTPIYLADLEAFWRGEPNARFDV